MKRVQIIRDIAQNAQSFTGLQGEVTATNDTFELRLHDGRTPGGHRFLPLETLGTVFQPADPLLDQLGALAGQPGFVTSLLNGELAVSIPVNTDTNIVITHANGDNGAPSFDLNTSLNLSSHAILGGIFQSGKFSGDGSGLHGVAAEVAPAPGTAAIDPTLPNKIYFGGTNYILPALSAAPANFTAHVQASNPGTAVFTTGADLINGTFSSYRIPFGGMLSLVSSGDQWHILDAPANSVGDITICSGGVDTPFSIVCDGRALSRATYANLFNLITTAYGVGDGATTFNIPDLRGRVIVGTGAGAGLTPRGVATGGGEETHVLTTAELAAHNHTGSVDSQGVHAHGGSTGVESQEHTHGTALPSGSGVTAGGVAAAAGAGVSAATSGNPSAQHTHPISADGGHVHNVSINNNGSGVAHNNMQPFLVMFYRIQL